MTAATVKHAYQASPPPGEGRGGRILIWMTEEDAERFRHDTGYRVEIDTDIELQIANPPSNSSSREPSITPTPTPTTTSHARYATSASHHGSSAASTSHTSFPIRPPSQAASASSVASSAPPTPSPSHNQPDPLFLPSSTAVTPGTASSSVPEQDVDMYEEDPLFSDERAPIREQISTLPFTRPTDFHEEPEANHPSAWFDNVHGLQAEAWRMREDGVLVRVGGEGFATEAARRMQLGSHVLSLLFEAFGPQPGARISIPSPHHAVSGTNQPPFSYLLWGLTPEFRNRLLDIRYITTDRGILFFTPNRPEIPRLITSLSHFSDTDPDELRTHIRNALMAAGLNQYMYALIPTHPQLSLMPIENAVEAVWSSLDITIVRARQSGGGELLVAHVYIESPTRDPAAWTTFQGAVEAVSFAHPLLGMEMAVFRDWRCRYCHSTLHPSGLCHLLSEPGWIIPQAFHAPAPQNIPALPINPIQQPAPAPAAYTTVAPPQANRGGFNNHRGRGRGAGRRGRGRGH